MPVERTHTCAQGKHQSVQLMRAGWALAQDIKICQRQRHCNERHCFEEE